MTNPTPADTAKAREWLEIRAPLNGPAADMAGWVSRLAALLAEVQEKAYETGADDAMESFRGEYFRGQREERAAVVRYCDKPGPVGTWKARQDLAAELLAGDHLKGDKP